MSASKLKELNARAGEFYEFAGTKLAEQRDLKCEACGQFEELTSAKASEFLREGWPRHCGYTMALVAKPVKR